MRLAAELQTYRAGCPAGERAGRRVAARRSHLGGSSRRSLRHRCQYSRHSSQVARQHRQLEVLVDSLDAAIRGLSNPADGLAPAEVLFDALANHLANAIADVPRGAAVDRAAALMRVVARDVRRHFARSAIPHKVAHVVTLVGAERLGVTTRYAIEQVQRTCAFGETVGMADHGPNHQARAVLHQDVPLITKDGSALPTLTEQARIRIGARFMRVVAAPLTLPVGVDIATTAGWRVVRTVLGPEALVAGPRLDQRAIDREVFSGQQPLLVGQAHDFGKERFDYFVLKQTIAVLREHRVVPDGVFDGEADEPAEQQVVAHLLHQHALAAHRVQHLQQQRAQQLLGRDRRTAAVRVDRAKQPIEPLQRLIDQQPKRPQRVIGRHEAFQLHRREQRFLHLVHSAHRSRLPKIMNTISLTHRSQRPFTPFRISTAC